MSAIENSYKIEKKKDKSIVYNCRRRYSKIPIEAVKIPKFGWPSARILTAWINFTLVLENMHLSQLKDLHLKKKTPEKVPQNIKFVPIPSICPSFDGNSSQSTI